MKIFTYIGQFFLFKGKDAEKNQKDFSFFKKSTYYLSALGFAWGAFLASKDETFTVLNWVFHNTLLICLASTLYQTMVAIIFSYVLRLFGFLHFDLVDSVEDAPTTSDYAIIEQIVAKVHRYEESLSHTLDLLEREKLTLSHIKEVRELASGLSTKKQTQYLNTCLLKKMNKLEKKVAKHTI